ncbi:DUF262 domain-containing protein [Alkalihalobacillus sp. CinArs1]|uniref:DUF262 domain-containing protein n=1 Tax=Alkalihalobacillus sp. CinArs1 TaxID=2995314 RepID=UPI0022DD299F|nr:DUF262 domain-containing HNH endonuclease family protein [Alkalihalobacillus sp. CinArs1]
MGIKNFGFETVETYLQKGVFYIPDYQREYSWIKDDQVEDFWTDLDHSVKENTDTHFFGQIVIHDDKNENKKYIIDGQQRTTTSVIFLAVLRDLFEEVYKDTDNSSSRNKFEDIRLKYIGRWSEEEDELRLTLGRIDKDYFRENIQISSPLELEPSQDSHKRIKEAYKYFETKMREKISNRSNDRDKYSILVEYYNKFINGFQLMYVETDEINEAFIIFETLNARGKDLETSDLLKNHLFRSSGNLIDQVKNKWLKTVDNLDNIDITKFLRHFWNSQYKFTREKDLYKKIRTHINSPKKSEEFVDNLFKMSDTYKALVNPSEEYHFTNSETQKVLTNLKTLKASSFYPIILAMKNNDFVENDIRYVLNLIETFIVRNNVVAGKVANKYEVLFAKIAHNISEKELITIDQIYKEFKHELLSDEEFENLFASFSVKSNTVAKYILKEINDFTENEVNVIGDGRVHLEHIMPKSLGDWVIDEETHRKYLNRIGNLTLLGNEYNRSIQNKVFTVKKGVYERSNINITKPLSKYTQWTLKEIENRQMDLFKIAVERWKLC